MTTTNNMITISTNYPQLAAWPHFITLNTAPKEASNKRILARNCMRCVIAYNAPRCDCMFSLVAIAILQPEFYDFRKWNKKCSKLIAKWSQAGVICHLGFSTTYRPNQKPVKTQVSVTFMGQVPLFLVGRFPKSNKLPLLPLPKNTSDFVKTLLLVCINILTQKPTNSQINKWKMRHTKICSAVQN